MITRKVEKRDGALEEVIVAPTPNRMGGGFKTQILVGSENRDIPYTTFDAGQDFLGSSTIGAKGKTPNRAKHMNL